LLRIFQGDDGTAVAREAHALRRRRIGRLGHSGRLAGRESRLRLSGRKPGSARRPRGTRRQCWRTQERPGPKRRRAGET